MLCPSRHKTKELLWVDEDEYDIDNDDQRSIKDNVDNLSRLTLAKSIDKDSLPELYISSSEFHELLDKANTSTIIETCNSNIGLLKDYH